jgi:glutaredoxin 2
VKLYIYDHCPFCVKARMIFGLKNIPVELNVLLNDDEATPTRMIGKNGADTAKRRQPLSARKHGYRALRR